MSLSLLVCTDLDRTLLPNGEQPESPGARPLFARLAEYPHICLAYVSGRHLGLLTDALEHYRLPQPAFAVCDVGTNIYRREGANWRTDAGWAERLENDWRGWDGARLQPLLVDLSGLRLQEAAKQGRFKLSYYAPADADARALLDAVEIRLAEAGVRAGLVWSVDETVPVGLLDILPRSAGKLPAIEYLCAATGIPWERCVFAGDSGNDLPVLTSRVPSVLVANATPELRAEAQQRARCAGNQATLYLARGGYRGLNGNYAAGILEGVVHYHPQLDAWLAGAEP